MNNPNQQNPGQQQGGQEKPANSKSLIDLEMLWPGATSIDVIAHAARPIETT
jgi:hypothetical protein